MDAFIENFKIFWNQPIPIIGFTIGSVIIGLVVVISKTSIGKKALTTIVNKFNLVVEKNNLLIEEIKTLKNQSEEIIKTKNEELENLKNDYEIKLSSYKAELEKQSSLIKIICENSVNKNIKEAFKNYDINLETLPVNEIIEKAKNEAEKTYNDRLKALEDYIYGREETINDKTTSE